MKASLNNFFHFVKNLVMGGGREKDGTTPVNDSGYLHDMNLPLSSIQPDSAAVVLTDSTTGVAATTLVDVTATPTQATINANFASIAVQLNRLTKLLGLPQTAAETNLRVFSAAASTTAVGTLTFVVPRDYDEATDTLALKLVLGMAGATDTPKVTVAAYRKRAGAAIVTVSAGVQGAALSSAAVVQEFSLTKQSLLRDDVITIIITSEAHTTDALYVYAVEPVYRSTLVSYHETDGTRDGKDGNLLR